MYWSVLLAQDGGGVVSGIHPVVQNIAALGVVITAVGGFVMTLIARNRPAASAPAQGQPVQPSAAVNLTERYVQNLEEQVVEAKAERDEVERVLKRVRRERDDALQREEEALAEVAALRRRYGVTGPHSL